MKKLLLFTLATVLSAGMYAQTLVFEVLTPSEVAKLYDFSDAGVDGSGWSVPDMTIDTNAIQGELAFVAEGDEVAKNGCDPLADPSRVDGKIAVLWRGACEFGAKAKNAQDAGAIGVIIINNADEGTMSMGGGAFGVEVTIPVWMISRPNGEALTAAIEAGTATAFYGAKALDYDLTVYNGGTNFPSSTARPRAISNGPGEFGLDPGFSFINNGVEDQTGITASVVIAKDGTTLAEESVSDLSAAAGDTLFVAFAPYYPNDWETGNYTMTYNVTSANADGLPDDNMLTAKVKITDAMFSYHPVAEGAIDSLVAYGSIRGVDAQEYVQCAQFRDANASRMALDEVSFYASGVAGYDISGEYIEIQVNTWYDGDTPPDTDINAPADEWEFAGFGEYNYPGDDRFDIITVQLEEPIELQDNMRYIVCIKSSSPDVYLGNYYVGDINYTNNINETYKEPMDVVGVDGTWYYSGFGAEYINGIGLHFDLINSVDDVRKSFDSDAYPNPAFDHVVMPINVGGATEASVEVFDLAGKSLMTLDANILESRGVKINTADLSAGTYMFRVTTNNGLTANTKVVIAK